MNKLEQLNYAVVTSTVLIMVVFAFLLLFSINLVQARINRIARR